MDSVFYNCEMAKKALDDAESERNVKAKAQRQLAYCEVKKFTITEFDSPKSWRLALMNAEDGTMEEAHTRLRGIVAKKLLPPIGKASAKKKDRHHLRQAVTVTGLGNNDFHAAMQNIVKIHAMFTRQFPKDALKPLQFEHFMEHVCLDAHTRYFTNAKLAKGCSHVPFDRKTDSTGALETLADEEYIHIWDNTVEYRGLTSASGTTTQTEKINPISIREGDVVELSLAFVAYPAKDSKNVLIPIIRGILLLDQSVTEDADIKRAFANIQGPTTATMKTGGTKRSTFEDDESDVSEGEIRERTREKMAKMTIDEVN